MYVSKIQWCEYTHNFWHGCKKIDQECSRCYMFRNKSRVGEKGSVVYRLSDKAFYAPLYLEEGKIIFTCSYSDFFLDQADGWREDAWDVIRKTPQHTWLILTKRPERIIQCLPPDWGTGWQNVWLGVSIGKQDSFHRAATLANIPAAIRFISGEPLLEELDFLTEMDGKRLIDSFQWVILGGESGDEFGPYQYRPCKIEWLQRAIHDLQTQTQAKVFVKQLGSHLSKEMGLKEKMGGNIHEFPEELQIRDFPAFSLTE